MHAVFYTPCDILVQMLNFVTYRCCSYSWIIRWRADYRPDRPLPPLSHAFWDEPTETTRGEWSTSKTSEGVEKKGIFGLAGMWAGGWLDDDHDNGGGDGDGEGGDGERVGGGVAGVYVPTGSNRVFIYVSDDFVVVDGSGGDHNHNGEYRVDDQ